jgi:hypothetical protein
MLYAVVLIVACNAFAGEIPRRVMDAIEKNAKLDHPGDQSTQRYVIKKEVAAYEALQDFEYDGINSATINRIKKLAETSHRDDYSTQLYVVRKECAAYVTIEEIKFQVRSDIRAEARASFPNDYSTQLYMMRQGLR